MRNCLTCKHFSHKTNAMGMTTSERVCDKGLYETMLSFFHDSRPVQTIPPLICCDIDMNSIAGLIFPKEEKVDPTTVEISTKLKLNKNTHIKYARTRKVL